MFGLGVAENKAEALRLFKLSAKQGLREAMVNLATFVAEGMGGECAPVQAVLWMRRAAEVGDAGAQNVLARWYMDGINSLPANHNEAVRLARLSAEQGSASSACLVGFLCASAGDLDEVCSWYRQAAALGDSGGVAAGNLRAFARGGHVLAVAAMREVGLGPL